MNVFILYAHAEPQSFNGALYRTAIETLEAAGHSVAVTDLHAEAFDPVSDRRNFTSVKNPDYFKQQVEELHASDHGGFAPDVERELEKLESCDLMIWQFPISWFGLPGVMKGWVDRIFVAGRIYGRGRVFEKGIFRGRRALLSLTTGGSAESFAPDGAFGDINAILRPIHYGILEFVGFSVLAPEITYGPARMAPEARAEALSRYRRRLGAVESEAPIEVGHF